jgi:hypothetical protein
MKLVRDVQDYGSTADVFCPGISSITDLGGGILRVSFFAVREEDDGVRNQVVDTPHLVRRSVPRCSPYRRRGIIGVAASQAAMARGGGMRKSTEISAGLSAIKLGSANERPAGCSLSSGATLTAVNAVGAGKPRGHALADL